MSASLYDIGVVPYESYPKTEYVKEDKTFGELKIGDTLYAISYLSKIKLKVTKSLHTHNGKTYLSCVNGKKKYNICFGSNSCANVLACKDNSVAHIDGKTIGTNLESVINVVYKEWTDDLKEIQTKHNIIMAKLKWLNEQ